VAPELRGLGLPPQAIEAAIRRGEPAMPAFHPSEIDAVELRQFAQWLSASPPPLGSQR
jgi:hypothetical protein